MATFTGGDNFVSIVFCLPSEKGSILKGKPKWGRMGGGGGKFFPFRVDPFLEGA